MKQCFSLRVKKDLLYVFFKCITPYIFFFLCDKYERCDSHLKEKMYGVCYYSEYDCSTVSTFIRYLLYLVFIIMKIMKICYMNDT